MMNETILRSFPRSSREKHLDDEGAGVQYHLCSDDEYQLQDAGLWFQHRRMDISHLAVVDLIDMSFRFSKLA